MFKKIITLSLVFSFISVMFFVQAPASIAKTPLMQLVPTAEMRTPLVEEKDLDSCLLGIIGGAVGGSAGSTLGAIGGVVGGVLGLGTGCSFDSIAWILAKSLMGVEFEGMLNMAQTGFFGMTSFLDNPEKYFSAITGEVTDSFILSDFENANLLSSIKNSVRENIRRNETTPFTEKISRGIDFPGGDSGYQSFLSDWNSCPTGNGWDCYDALLSEKNDPFYVGLKTEAELSKKQNEALTHTKDEVQAGGGYRDNKNQSTCDTIGGAGGYVGHYLGCESVTPGGTIKDQINDYLMGSFRQLETADELDETITAGVQSLYKAVVAWLNGGGLSGM